MTREEKIRFRVEREARTHEFAADVAMFLKRFGGIVPALFFLPDDAFT